MSTMSNAIRHSDPLVGTVSRKAAAALRRWWVAYVKWRLNQLAIRQLNSMSDRQLKDMGLSRGQIDFAVGRHAPSHMFSRHC